jgi:glycine oxidase
LSRPDVLVVGGGIIGFAIARELARGGRRVELLERLSAGAEASLAAAGMLAPLAEAPEASPFFEACRDSRDLWAAWVPALEAESDLSIDYNTEGALVIAADPWEQEALARLAAAARELGERVDAVVPTDFLPRIPALSEALGAALFLPGEHRVDNVQALTALSIAAQRAGVEVSRPADVLRVEALAGGSAVRVHLAGGGTREAEWLVLAAGTGSAGIDGLPPLPVRPVRGQMLLLSGADWPFGGTLRSGHHYAVRRGATGLVVGSTLEEAGFANHATVRGVGSLLAFVERFLPGLAEARLEAVWAGLRPATPDALPLLGRLPGLPVVVATGHFRNGILLAPWTARRIAALVESGDDAELAPFSPGRFG